MADSKAEKKPKKKGPIRFEAIVPTFLVFAAIGAYGYFFFDHHLKKMLELVGSYTYGAEVNIDDIDSSFFGGRMKIKRIQVTDIDRTERNLFEIGEIRFGLNWDALLRAKFVISEAAIDDILLHSPRKRPGRIYRTKDESGSLLESAKDKVLESAQEQLAGNIFGDAAALLSGYDPTAKLDEIKGELATKKKIDSIQADLQKKEDLWKKRIDELPNKKELEAHLEKIKKLKFDTKNPQELAKSIQTGSEILKEADKDIRTIKSDSEALRADLKNINESVKELDQTRKEDLKNLQSRIAIPELDAKSIALLLFGNELRKHLATAEKYAAMVKEHMPDKDPEAEKAKEAKKISPRERALGRSYEFPTTKSYPLFWLQKASISSKSQNSSFSGDLKGQVMDVTSNSKLLNRPTVVTLAGDFPHQQVFGLDSKLTLDLHRDQMKSHLAASVKQFPLAGREFSKSEKVKFGFQKATGSAEVQGTLAGDQIDLQIKNSIRDIDYTVAAESKSLQEALVQVSKDVPMITVDAHAKGFWRSPGLSLQTNLARAIQESLSRQLQAKVAEAKAKLQGLIDEQVKEQKDKLMAQLNQFQSQYTKELDKLKDEAEKIKGQATAQLDKFKGSSTKKVENKAKEEAKKLLKKLKF